MWLSRKISLLLKHKSTATLQQNKKRKEQHISFVLAVTSAVKNTGKSTLIQILDLEEIIKYNNSTLQPPTIGKLYRLKNNSEFIIHIIEYNEILPLSIKSLDGVFICYDTTNRDSMDYLPDITNTFISQHIPCLLIGLKSDLTLQRTVDTQLGHLIGNLFGVQAIESNTMTCNGIQLLQNYFIQFIYSDQKMLQFNKRHHPITANGSSSSTIMSRSSSCSTAATTTTTTTTTNKEKEETILNIVDQVIHTMEQDENMCIIFLTVFRKFMKPLDLVNILIQRFESDSPSLTLKQCSTTKETLPTTRQERIGSIFHLWLSRYWGDFTSSATRRILLTFLDKLSNDQAFSCIYKDMESLVTREPAPIDQDSYWGLCDEVKRKKDSGYCESFGDWIGQQQQQEQKTVVNKLVSSCSLKRVSSNNSHPLKSIVSLGHQRTITPSDRCPVNFGGGWISIIEQEYIRVDPFEIMSTTLPIKLAEQLTWVEIQLFQKIQPRDFLRHVWKDKKTNTAENPVLASIEHFNFISGWIASLVVHQPILEKRIIVYEYCLNIAIELKRLNNFNTLMAVLAGINSAAVLRLKITRESVRQRNKKLVGQFTELESLMSSERSFHNYRSTLKSVTFGIPYLGIHQQDLVSLGEANKDHKTDGKVHWKKFRLMGESILEMTRFQYPTTPCLLLVEPNPYLLYFIGHESIPTEDERYEKSQEIEPRVLKPSVSTSTSSTSSRWLTVALK